MLVYVVCVIPMCVVVLMYAHGMYLSNRYIRCYLFNMIILCILDLMLYACLLFSVVCCGCDWCMCRLVVVIMYGVCLVLCCLCIGLCICMCVVLI